MGSAFCEAHTQGIQNAYNQLIIRVTTQQQQEEGEEEQQEEKGGKWRERRSRKRRNRRRKNTDVPVLRLELSPPKGFTYLNPGAGLLGSLPQSGGAVGGQEKIFLRIAV